MYRYPKNCIFCGRSPTTKEDVWPTWLTQYVPRDLKSYHGALAEIDPSGEITKTQKKWDGDPRSRRSQCVCRECNNEWMSRIQERAKPVVLKLAQAQSATLSIHDQKVLATWATMSAMTSEYIQPSTVAISQLDRERFYKTKGPLKLWKIWIGNYSRENWRPHRIHHAWPVRTRVRDESKLGANAPPNTQTTTLIFGNLFLHVASTDIPNATGRMTFPDEVSDTIFKRIWPARSGTIRWPPRLTMSDRHADSAAGYLFLSMTGLLWKKPALKM
jgi:hypothetical protein